MPSAVAPASRSRRSPSSHQETLSALRREAIIEAAIRLFGRKGFEATRAEDIAVAAKIAKGTVYLYFKNKEAIYGAAVAQAVRNLQAEIARLSSGAGSFRAELATTIRVRLEFWPEHEGIYRLLLTVGREPRQRRQTSELLRQAHAGLMAIFARGVEAGELTPQNFAPLAWATLDMIRGATERRMDKVSARTPQEDADWITAVVLRELSAGEEQEQH